METIYCIPGLGADEKLFKYLDFGKHEVKYLNWFEPLTNEQVHSYAERMVNKYEVKDNGILIGISFGGIMSVEVAKLLPMKKVILMSTVKTSDELNPFYKLSSKLRLSYLAPLRPFINSRKFLNWYFHAKTHEEKQEIYRIAQNLTMNYLRWSLHQISSWKNKNAPENVVHIQGEFDRIFPAKYLNNYISIKDTGHFMVYHKAHEVNEILTNILKNEEKNT